MLSSNLSFEEYSAWCRSRFPEIDPGPAPDSYANTIPASTEEPCPVTVRSARGCVLVTPNSQRSR